MRKRCLAEFIGTFVIVFAPIALSAGGRLSGHDLGLVAAALASGLPVLAMIYSLGPISAAHFNPAVTLGFAVAGRFPWKHVTPYWLSQLSGAVLAGGFSALLFGPGGGVHIPADPSAIVRNLGVEMILSFILMFVIIASAKDKRVSGVIPAVAIGFTVVFCVLVGGVITGGSMNPARSLGANIFGGPPALNQLWLYLAAPFLGAVLGARAYEAVRFHPEAAQSAPADL